MLNLDAELFPRIHWTGCAAGINRLQSGEPRNAPQHQRSDAPHRCLEPSYQFSSEPHHTETNREKKKKAQFQIFTYWGITVMKGPLVHVGIWMR